MPKRLFDILTSITGLIILSPVLIFICFLIKILMPGGPILFIQFRTGRYGKLFKIYKFRTMKMNHSGNTISIKGEKRITPLGSFLRKHKLDELPELWNVLKGDMSLVGPRPDMPEYTDKLIGHERLILELRPGITGPATLVYANEEEILAREKYPHKYNDEVLWPNKIKLNLEYYYNRSFFGDLMIIIKTVFLIKRFE